MRWRHQSAGGMLAVLLVTVPASRADDKATAGTEITRQPATIVPAKVVRISPRVGGTVGEVLVREGDAVKSGQVLARLDRVAYELELRQAEAALDRAKAAVGEAEARVVQHRAAVDGGEAAVKEAAAQAQVQQRKAERLRGLLKNNAVDRRLVDEADAEVGVAAARLRQAEAQLAGLKAEPNQERLTVAKADVATADARLNLAKFRLDGAEVRSPIAGTVLARHAAVGDAVAPLSDGRPDVLFEVGDLSHFDAAVDIPDNVYLHVTVGLPCEIRVDAIPGQTFKGRLVRVAPALTAATRTAPARVQIDVPSGSTLRPGMYGVVRVLAK